MVKKLLSYKIKFILIFVLFPISSYGLTLGDRNDLCINDTEVSTTMLPTYSDVIFSVRWPANSGENRVKVYSPSNVLLATIDDGYDGSLGNYSTTETFLCLEDLNGYYFVMEDLNDNGWEGTDNITITIDGTDIINTDNIGNSATAAGVTQTFNVSGGTCGAKIDVKGIGNSITPNASPLITNDTDFGTVQIVSETAVRTYTIENIGSEDITLGTINLMGDSKFNIVSFPASGTVLAAGAMADIEISFSTLTETPHTTVLTINSDAINNNSYVINISASGGKVFYDSDNDSVYDDIDIDDDNDGIKDSIEEDECNNSSSAIKANYKFLNESFGDDVNRGSSISSLYSATTSYCYEDGVSGSSCNSSSNLGLNDGEYTVHSKITTGVAGETVGPTNAIASWAYYAWANIEDHTPDDTNGRMAIFNADYDPGIFYETKITGTLTGIPITYSFYVINIDNEDANFSSGELDAGGHRILPNVTVRFLTTDRSTILATFNTGYITRCNGDVFVDADHTGPAGTHAADATYNKCTTSEWKYFSQNLTLNTESAFIVQFINNAPGGLGNDLAIDDIEIKQTLCDTDGDGVANIFDLDSDDDGIPDVVENGHGLLSNGKGKILTINDVTTVNGMHDSSETYVMVDTDGDGIPNYLDLDSDNDGIFDVDESGAGNSSDGSFQNGDGDIDGDGTGDGLESEFFREKDTDGDGNIEGYGDGILDIYDFFEGNSYAAAYGNNNQGNATTTGWHNYVVDTDNDGIPDYMDTTSNGTTFDIANTLYANLDVASPVDGVIDDVSKTDTDGDGILDVFDTDDVVFGSPRDLDRKLHLYFDGRNDYVEDASIITNPASTIMGWIKLEAVPTGIQRIFGQDNFYLQIDSNSKISAVGASTLTYDTAVTLNQWTHIAATYSCCEFKLYINGVEVKDGSGGSIAADTSLFTIGRRSNTDSNYFRGYIDEVRVFSKALTVNELQKIVYQEIEDNGGTIKGSVLDVNITDYSYNNATGIETDIALGWANLLRYYRMDTYKHDIIDDLTTSTIDTGTGAKMYNMKVIDVQTAPLPFVTQAGNTDLASALTTPEGVNGLDAFISPASIVKIEHDDVYANESQKHVALFVSSGRKFIIKDDSELNISRYLYLNGAIDLEGESQLVQGGESILDTNSGGYIERDQQGTSNSFNYNYWASPVGEITTGGFPTFTESVNENYVIKKHLLDGRDALNPRNDINYVASAYAADTGPFSAASPLNISTYWLYKFYGLDDDYDAWIKINENTALLPGEGYTIKGSMGATDILDSTLDDDYQNYVFKGKPHNGDITLPIDNSTEEVDRLIGNPYPSAIDAYKFIKDNLSDSNGGTNINGNIFNGSLYFWDHFGQKNSHVLQGYVGGYATFNLSGGTPGASNDARIDNNGDTGTKVPGQYIPVGQAFFVFTTSVSSVPLTVSGGDIVFKNSQRVFKTEKELDGIGNPVSVFMKGSKGKEVSVKEEPGIDTRAKIRLLFDSPKGYHRQLLISLDENTSNDFDLGYDALMPDIAIEDMFWIIQDSKFVIQGVSNFNVDQEFPLGLKVSETGLASIKIESLENLDDSTNIYLKDALTGTTTQINNESFEIILEAGTYLDRFSLTFAPQEALGVEEDLLEQGLQVFMNNTTAEIQITNTIQSELKSIKLYNSIGQLQQVWNNKLQNKLLNLPVNNKSTGMYIVQIQASSGIISKKIVIE